jgi:hypothetical protein
MGFGILIEVINPTGIEGRGPANHAVNFVSLREQKLGEITAILTCDTRDERFFHEGVEQGGFRNSLQACPWSPQVLAVFPGLFRIGNSQCHLRFRT